jgi:hypothetical protein
VESIASIDVDIGNPSYNQAVARTIAKTVSGFVHGASPQIMEMYGGAPPHFYAHGMLGTPRMRVHEHDIWNYFDHGIGILAFAAGAFRDSELFQWVLSRKKNCEI